MDAQEQQLEVIKSLLKASPNGLKITQVSEKLNISRNSAAKYLDILLRSGEVEMKAFGMSKIYRLSERQPLAGFTSLSSEKICVVDNCLRVTEVNERFLSFSGLRREDIIGHLLKDIDVDLLRQSEVLLNIKEALRGKEFKGEASFSRNGDEYYFNLKLIPLNTHAPPQVAIVYENISGRKKAEKALKSSESRYRELVEDTTDLICLMRPDSTITFVNDTCEKLWGVGKKELMGRKLYEVLPQAAVEVIKGRFEKIVYKNDFQMFDYHLTGDKNMWLRWTLHGIFDANNRLIEYRIMAHDISNTKKTDVQMNKIKENPMIRTNARRVGTFEMDCLNGKVSWSPEIEEMYGLSKDRFSSPMETWAYLIYPGSPPVIVRQVKKGPDCDTYESIWHVEMSEGPARWIHRCATHYKDERGLPVKISATNIEIAGYMQAQEILDRLAIYPDVKPVPPVIEFDLIKGIINVSPSGLRIFPDLRDKGLGHPMLAGIKDIIAGMLANNEKRHVREVEVNGMNYMESIFKTDRNGNVKIFVLDNTNRKPSSESLM